MQAETSELESIRRRLQDARVESEATTAKTTMMAERMHQLDGEMERLQREVLANENEQQNLENAIAESTAKKAELAQRTEDLMGELSAISGGREEFTAQRIVIAGKQEAAALALASAQKALEDAEKKRNQAALESVKQNAEYEHVLDQLQNDYGGELMNLGLLTRRRLSSTPQLKNAMNFCRSSMTTLPKPKTTSKALSAR